MRKNIRYLTTAVMIAAMYVVLCLILRPFSYGEVQVRVAEALTILPYFTSAAIPGLFIGCIIANLLGGSIIIDVVFGSLATLLAAIFTYLLRKQNRFLASLPPIVFNALIVPYVLKYGYGLPFTIGFMTLTVAIGEIISCGILGQILLAALNKRKDSIFVD